MSEDTVNKSTLDPGGRRVPQPMLIRSVNASLSMVRNSPNRLT